MDPHNTGSANKPPMLVRNEYNIWQRRISHTLNQQNTGCWRSVIFGPHKPTTTDPETKIETPKDPKDYTDDDFLRFELDAKAFSMLAMALPNEIYSGLLHCENAKELWDCLKEQFGGTDEVIANTREILAQQYETFTHVNGETLTQQFERFSSLISELKLNGQTYTNSSMLHRFLRSLPEKWETYSIVLRSSSDFDSLTLTKLHGRLLTFEREINQKKRLQTSGKTADDYVPGSTALMGQDSPTCSNDYGSFDHIDITSGIFSERSYPKSDNDGNHITDNLCFIMDDLQNFSNDDLEEMDILHQLAMLSMKTNKFYKKSGRKFPGLSGQTRIGFDKSKLRCHKCQKLGHFARECRSSSYNNPQSGNQQNTSYNRNQGTQGSAHFAAPNNNYIQTQAPTHIQYVPQIQYVQVPMQQGQQQQQMPSTPAAHPPQTQQPTNQSLFTSGYVDWSSLPNDMSDQRQDDGTKIFDVNWNEPDNGQKNFALMAFESSSSDALSQVSKSSLSKLCSKSCIEAFALIRETNVFLQGQHYDLERKHSQMKCDSEKKLTIKSKEVSKLKNEAIETQAQIKIMVENLGEVRKELADTKVNCETWVESCKGYQMLLNKQSASNVKFGIGYNHIETPTDFTPKTNNDGSAIMKNESSEFEENTSFHQNFLQITDEKPSEVQTSDIMPSVVLSTSEVETLKTTEDKSVKTKHVSEVSANNSNKKGKTKPCEVCGLFNHTSEVCRYRKGKEFNHKIKMLAEGQKIKKNFEKTFYPNEHQSNKTLSIKRIGKSQPQSLSYKQKSNKYSKNTYSEVLPLSSAVSQTAEVNQLIHLVKLLMTKVDGKPQKVPTIVSKGESMTTSAWISKNGQKQTVTLPILKSKPKAKLAWVPKTN